MMRSVLIHSSLRADDADVRARCLSSGQVDPSLHYRSFHQAQLWWQVHQAHAPKGDRGVLGIYTMAASATASGAARRLHVVAVASGGGEKEATLVRALVEQGSDVHYFPVDISVELALRSAEGAERGGLACTPIAGDISAMPDFRGWLNTQQGALAGDENPEADSTAVVAKVGVASSLSPIRFHVGEVDGIPAVVASAHWLADQQWRFGAEEQLAPAGEELRVFFSLRFTPELFAAMCERFGLEVLEEFIDESSGEGVWRVRALLPAEGPGSHGRAGDSPAEQ